jgi:iron complex transport system substrate-binding protein
VTPTLLHAVQRSIPDRRAPVVDDATRRQLLGVLGAAGLLSACGGEGDPAASGGARTREVVDASGTTVRIPADPQRVVAGDINTTAALLDLGVVPVAAGVVPGLFEKDFHPELFALGAGEIDAYTRDEPNYELLAGLDADLVVIAQFMVDQGGFDRYRDIAPVVTINTTPGAIGTVENVAAALGREEQARDLIDGVLADVRTAGRRVRLDSLSLAHPAGDGQFFVFTDAHVITGLLAEALGVDIRPGSDITAEAELQGGAYLSPELLAELSGEALVVFDIEGVPPLSGNPLYANLPAVRSGLVVEGGFDTWTYEGFGGLRAMGALLTDLADRIAALQ